METLNQLSESLGSRLGDILPSTFGALLLLLIGLLIASGVKRLVSNLFKKSSIDEKLASQMNTSVNIGSFVAKLAYYLVVLFVLMMVLSMLGIDEVLAPLSNMLNEFLAFLPNLIAAGIIGFAGYVIATIASEAVGFGASKIQSFSASAGLSSSIDLMKIAKQLVFILVFLPLLIAALDALQMEVISEPATEMFSSFLQAIPKIISAVIIIGVFFLAGRYVSSMLSSLLANLGVDQMSESLGLGSLVSSNTSLSKMIGNLVFFFLLFTGIITAAGKLEMPQLTDILETIFGIAGRVVFGLVILLLGNFLANLAKKTLAGNADNAWLSSFVYFAVLFIFLALGLSTMGIAEDIVQLAFGLTIGALAIAFALAFGLGGREPAKRFLNEKMDDWKK